MILQDINKQFQQLIPILMLQNSGVTLGSFNIQDDYTTQIVVTITPSILHVCPYTVQEERKLQIDVDGKEAQIHFPNGFSLILPSENISLSTIYVIIDQINLLINYIERIKNGTNTD